MKKIPDKFHKGALSNHLYFLMIFFSGIALKLEKAGPSFSSLNPCPSLPSFAKDDSKQFQCLNIVLKNKAGPLFLEVN